VELFDLIRDGKIKPIVSEHTIKELVDERTPKEVLDNLYTFDFVPIATTEEMTRLGDLYLKRGIIDINNKRDAVHVAIASILEVDVLATWNMTHIVNPNHLPLFNKVNRKEGFKDITILKPEEIIAWLKR
jgi:hypothetical protein